MQLDTPVVTIFPTKHDWHTPNDPELIVHSVGQLMTIVNEFEIRRVALLRPGCDNYGLQWPDVRESIKDILDDRILIVTL